MDFADLEKINVTKHIEKKGRFSYLSWPYAVSEFRKACPKGTWKISQYGEIGQPYCQTASGCFVCVEVIPDIDIPGVSFSQVHPVLDNKNQTLTEPNAFQVNTSIQRCLVKAIALATGIGLHIYAGEDLPPAEAEDEKQAKFDQAEHFNQLFSEIDKCQDGKSLAEWFTKNEKRIAQLNETNKGRLRDLYRQYLDVFNSKKKEA